MKNCTFFFKMKPNTFTFYPNYKEKKYENLVLEKY